MPGDSLGKCCDCRADMEPDRQGRLSCPNPACDRSGPRRTSRTFMDWYWLDPDQVDRPIIRGRTRG